MALIYNQKRTKLYLYEISHPKYSTKKYIEVNNEKSRKTVQLFEKINCYNQKDTRILITVSKTRRI